MYYIKFLQKASFVLSQRYYTHLKYELKILYIQ